MLPEIRKFEKFGDTLETLIHAKSLKNNLEEHQAQQERWTSFGHTFGSKMKQGCSNGSPTAFQAHEAGRFQQL